MSATSTTRSPGRPEATTHAEIEQAAFRLFDARGFEQTTLDAIAEEVGVSRRTLFRYYPSKNDIPWGQFEESLTRFAASLRARDALPIGSAVEAGVIEFNDFPRDALALHRRRMRLLLRTPALVGHSELRYTSWRAVVADYVAERRGTDRHDLRARVAGRVSLAVALSAYDVWLEDGGELGTLLQQAFAASGLTVALDAG